MIDTILNADLKTVLAGLGAGSALLGAAYYFFFADKSETIDRTRIDAELAEKQNQATQLENSAETKESLADEKLAQANDLNASADVLRAQADQIHGDIEASKRAEREALAKAESSQINIEGLSPDQVNDEFAKRGF